MRAARDLGFGWITANDHLVFHRPWLDGPSALAAVLSEAEGLTLATTISLPVLRHPVPLAKALGTFDVLSGGRVVAGVGPGSHELDYGLMGVPWQERWPRFEEAVAALRALWDPDGPAFDGRFYATGEVRLEPAPARPGGPPIWLGSWGSDAGLRRVARLGDGWMASSYNTTPEGFREARGRLGSYLEAEGRDPASFPNALASAFFCVTDDAAEAGSAVETIASALGRPQDEARERLLIGSASECAEKLSAFASAGVERVFLWPIGDELTQLEAFASRVAPTVR